MISDGYGEQPQVEDFIAEMNGWLYAYARTLLSPDDHRYGDLVQEGRITLWRTWGENPDNNGGYAVRAAKNRMLSVLRHHRGERQSAPLTGATEGRTYEAKVVASLDQPIGEDGFTLGDLIAEVVSIEGVEMAYHDGEIQQAINALTPRMQKYVYARFWCGMDPTDGLNNNPGMRMARAANPDLKRDVLWTGNKTMFGAKQRLAQALGHLEGASR
jgi:RNA polymerase sigma factor (sigma-70 family)